MDWMVMNPHFHGTFSSLGTQMGDTYQVSEDCLTTLCDILGKLTIEDRTLRTFRRAMGFAQVVKKDLVPLLVGVKDDAKITDVTVKILLNLTVPVECLLPMEVMLKTDVGRYTVMELNMLLSTSKEAFVSPQGTRAVVDHMKTILDKESNLSVEECESISNCLLLLRNILHIPEHRAAGSGVSMQNQILWNLFAQNVDKVLIHLMTSKHKAYWGVTMVQLIALMYKDQHVGTLQKLLNLWFESSLSDSSEGNESNTSPQHQASGDSSSLMTSDPTSDSSDNGGSNKKRNPYQSGDSKTVNNESDDSQSSEQGSASHPSQTPSGDAEHTNQHASSRVPHPHMSIGKLRVKSLTELQGRSRRADWHDSDSGNASQMDTTDSQTSTQGPPHSPSWSRQPGTKPGHSSTGSASSNSYLGQSHDLHGKLQSQSLETQGKTNSQPHGLHGKLHNQSHSTTHDSHNKHHQPLGQTVQGKACAKAHGKLAGNGESSSEVSDCGYGTQQENQESNSTSSNEDDAPHRCVKHQKPQHMLQKSRYSNGKPNITPQERKELHRKKLVKRSRTNTMHMKALLHHTPSDEDVSNLLKEFTVDFLLRGYSCLVSVLHNHLLESRQPQMDTSHFFWLVTYFLKFATQLELDLEHISSVLTIDVVSYLTYEGVNLYEELEMGIQCSGRDLKPCLRRMHLVVTSIREFIQAVEAYKKIVHLTEEDRSHLLKLQLQIAEVRDLRSLFVLLLREFNPSLQSQQFLQDLVVTNHNLLLFVENTAKLPQFLGNTQLVEHLKQFGSMEVMRSYGLLLENYQDNGEFVNDCILTMMHHVAGDLSQVAVLFQPSILRSMSLIWESDYEICDDWSDLIEYVIHKFMNNPPCNPFPGLAPSNEGQQISPSASDGNKTGWTKEDSNNLYWYYQQSCKNKDPVGAVVAMYENSGVQNKTRIAVIQQLLLQDVINDQQYEAYMETETVLAMSEKRSAAQKSEDQEAVKRKEATSKQENETAMQEDCSEPADEIQALRDQLVREGHGKVVQWLQKLLLETCYVKLCLIYNLSTVMEPIPYIYTRLQQSIPLVPWYADQRVCLKSPTFILLLHKLGFHLAGDAGKVFPHIPHFWTTDVLFQTAEKLGPVDTALLKFNLSLVKNLCSKKESTTRLSNSNEEMEDVSEVLTSLSSNKPESNRVGITHFMIPRTPPKPSFRMMGFTPTPVMSSMPNWLQVVQQSKAKTSGVQSPRAADVTENLTTMNKGSSSAAHTLPHATSSEPGAPLFMTGFRKQGTSASGSDLRQKTLTSMDTGQYDQPARKAGALTLSAMEVQTCVESRLSTVPDMCSSL